MDQLELKFFWPLTEQIPLDLDYTGCEKPKISTPLEYANTYKLIDGKFTKTNITASHLLLDVETTVIKTKENPPFYRRALYKMLGIKWEKK